MRKTVEMVCRLVFALALLMPVIGFTRPITALASPGESQQQSTVAAPDDPRYFAETGFRVADDRFWDYFNKRGGLRTFGYPISRKFTLLGYEVQFFQRRIMQLQPNGSVGLLNVLDQGIMPYASMNFATFPAPDSNVLRLVPAVGSANYYGDVLNFVTNNSPDSWQTLNVNFGRSYWDTVRFQDAYPDGKGDRNWMTGINFEMWGVPTSAPAVDPNNNDFVYLRFQRGVMHYDKKTGLTQGLLLADYLKSIITGENLPADLDSAAKTSPFYKQYNNATANGLNRPDQLPATNMKDALESDVAGGTSPSPTPSPVATATPTPTPPPATGGGTTTTTGLRYGMQAHMFGQDQPRTLGALQGAGFSWLKQQIRWDTIEGAKGQLNWGSIDELVNNAQAKGVNLLFSIVAAPDWATGNNPVDGPPNNYDDLANFVGAMASRYKGKVQAYEVWNEQNLWYEWGGQGKLNAANYIDMLRRARNAIKASDPNAIVISGALTPTGVNDGVNAIDDVVYLDQMYQAGLKDIVDGVGAHMAGYNNAPDDWVDRNTVNTPGYKGHPSFYFRRIDQLHDVMAKYGDNKQLWITEFEWGSVDWLPDSLQGYVWTTHLSEQQVADFYVQGIQGIKTQRPWVGAVFVWNLNWRIFDDPHKREQAIFGILNPDWTPRLIYSALRDMPK
ncbi:MAG: cellulase family glycosylhydrolase [Chloroflexi bacterium]|nr:cellulase family glycosylhydrolase [Chloroflexota bacterium]